MMLGPKNNVQRHLAQHSRDRAALIPQISYNCGVVTHQNDTLTMQLRQKSHQGQNNGFHLQNADVESRIVLHGGPEILETPLQRAHAWVTEEKSA